MKRFLSLVVSSLVVAVICVQGAWAIGVAPDDLEIDMIPATPIPGERIDVSLESFAYDLARSRVSFWLGDALQQQEIGVRNFSFQAPPVGQATQLRVVVESPTEGVLERTVDIRPVQVDLHFEPLSSYVPQFYKGKALNTHESGIKVVALPYFVDNSGQQINPKDLVYTWSVGNVQYGTAAVQRAESGYGRDSFAFGGSPIYRDKFVSVIVETVDGTLKAERTIELPAYEPKIVFYERNPVYGLNLRHAISGDTVLLEQPEMVVEAVPLFFSDINFFDRTEYTWRMNGEVLPVFGDRNLVNLRLPEAGEGQTSVSLEIVNNHRLLQIAENSFSVLFGSSAASQAGSRSGRVHRSTDYFGVNN